MFEKVLVPILIDNPELIPAYATEFASGCDVRANIQEVETLLPGCSVIIPTGIKVEIPCGYEIQVRPRSGLAVKNQITVLNTPGTIDADYRGEICVILINHGKNPFVIEPKMRIAQLVLAPVVQAKFIRKDLLAETSRGEGRFGHTGAQ